jgi:F0F1-type ATP synthase membrane subunit c/vacuolar-type H+-ATPase subunit K
VVAFSSFSSFSSSSSSLQEASLHLPEFNRTFFIIIIIIIIIIESTALLGDLAAFLVS